MKNNRPAYAINIATARKKLKLKQYQLAEMIYRTTATVGKYESGEAQPSHETWFLLCVVFDIKDLKSFLYDKDYFTKEIHKQEAA